MNRRPLSYPKLNKYMKTYIGFQGDTYVVVIFVSCLGVQIFVLFAPYVCSHILVKFLGN